MLTRPRLAALATGLILPLLALLAAGAAIPMEPDAFITSMKTRDLRFDNAALTYLKWETRWIDFHDWQFPPPAGTPARPAGIQFTHGQLIRLTVRGAESTFDGETIWPVYSKKNRPDVLPDKRHKCSDTAGVIRDISESYPRLEGRHDNIDIVIQPLDPARNLLPERRMEIEFALGFGYAKRIRENVLFEKRPDGTFQIEGLMNKIWMRDKTLFQLTVDPSGLVRHALIEAYVDTVVNVFDITTSGT